MRRVAAFQPPQTAQSLLQTLEASDDWTLERPKILRPLGGGLTNTSYLIEVAGRPFVLRLAAKTSQQWGLDRQTELEVQQRAHHAGLAPEIIFSDLDTGIQVTEYIDGRHLQTSDIQQPAQRHRLIELLLGIQSLSPPRQGISPETWVTRYRTHLAVKTNSDVSTPLAGIHEKMVRLMDAQVPADWVLGHADFITENLIVTSCGAWVAIDWEFAGPRHPLFDLATLIEQQTVNDDLSHGLLTEFTAEKPLSGDAPEQLAQQRILIRYLNLLWHAVRGAEQRWILAQANKLEKGLSILKP